MAAGHVYIDESAQQDYLLICASVAPATAQTIRGELRKLLLPGQRSLHMKDERLHRRRRIRDAVTDLDTQVIIYSANIRNHRGQTSARDACLRRASTAAVQSGVHRMVLDRNDPYVQRDLRSIIAGAQSAGAVPVPFSYHHQQRHEEPLLWIPDVVG